MKFLHSMLRVADPEASVAFFQRLGLTEMRRMDNERGRFTLIFLAAPEDVVEGSDKAAAEVELTYNWPSEDGGAAEEYRGGRNFGHLAFRVDDIYATCERLAAGGVTINRPPRDGHMAFVKSPDGISIELLQRGDPLPPAEPWLSAANEGSW